MYLEGPRSVVGLAKGLNHRVILSGGVKINIDILRSRVQALDIPREGDWLGAAESLALRRSGVERVARAVGAFGQASITLFMVQRKDISGDYMHARDINGVMGKFPTWCVPPA